MAQPSITNLVSFYKNRFPDTELQDLLAHKTDLLLRIKKKDELTGQYTYKPIEYGSPSTSGTGSSGLIHAISKARMNSAAMASDLTVSNPSHSHAVQARLEAKLLYAALAIDIRAQMAARDNTGAFFRLKEHEISRTIEGLGQRIERQLWGASKGSIGIISGAPTTGADGSFTLTNVGDAVNFQEGMVIQVFDDDAAGGPDYSDQEVGGLSALTLVDSTTSTYGSFVTSVNEVTGVIAVDNLPTDASDGDHLTELTSIADTNPYMTGVQQWIPSSDPGASEAFLGLQTGVRSKSPQKLAGWRVSWRGSIEETAKYLCAIMRRAPVDMGERVLWLSFLNFHRLELELGARAIRTEDGSKAKFDRPGFMMSTPTGPVEVRGAAYCPDNAGFVLDMSTWSLMTLGKLPHLIEDDGLSAMRIRGVGSGANLDAIQLEWRGFGEVFCANPYANGRFAIS